MISVPSERNPEHVLTILSNHLAKYPGLASSWPFSIPMNLKVGTLDVLVGLAEEFSKLELYSESVTRKVVHYMGEILEDQRHMLEDNLTVGGATPLTYVTKFQWDAAKFPIKQTLRALHDNMSEQLTRIDSDLRTKAAAYNAVKGNLQTMERKQTGSLVTRNLADIVKKEQFVLGSEYLQTILIVVPKHIYPQWESTYAKLTDMVVPGSSERIYEDQDNGLWTVTLFRKMADDFAQRARESKFIPRDFVYDEKKIEEDKHQLTKLVSDKKRQFPLLFRWLKMNFGESFTMMMHVKALRVFVESVLRYGLPVDFQAMILKPNKKSQKRLRDVLGQLYGHLDNMSASNIKDDEYTPTGMSSGEYYPYVSINVETNFIDAR